MKVSFIRIGKSPFDNEYSDIEYNKNPGVVRTSNDLSASIGYFYYDTELGVEKAFDTLRSAMIVHTEKQIERLQRDIEKLKSLKAPT